MKPDAAYYERVSADVGRLWFFSSDAAEATVAVAACVQIRRMTSAPTNVN